MKILCWIAVLSIGLFAQAEATNTTRTIYRSGSAIVVMAATTTVEDAIILQIDASGEMSNVIARLRATGRVCESAGHSWREGRPGEGEGSPWGGWYADYHPGVWYRTCRICGKCQSKSESDWK